ncbi:MAG: 2,3-bisphosphoglycerate-independent phosphoglycerate mutase, partial [Eubacterium sp.]
MKKTNVLCIMDGFGHNPSDYGNAVAAAKKPNLDMLMEKYPYTYIGASGLNVGLPDGQMGNSEVGHTNMGAGRVVYQELTRITKSIEDGDFFENEALRAAVQNAIDNNSSLHLMGLMSNGGVHSHNTHIWAIVELAKRMGLDRVYLHCIMDGRDVPPTSGKDFVAEAIEKMNEIGVGKVATVVGRYYAMDRDNNWDRVKKAYNALVFGEGIQASDPVEAIKASYET